MPELSSPRITLKNWTASSVIAALAGPAVLQLHLGLRVHPQWPNPDFAEALPELSDDLVRLGEQNAASLIVLRGAIPEVVGELGCKGFPDEHGTVELGFGIVPAHQKLGLATEAVQLFVGWLLRETPTRTIEAHVLQSNPASQRVLEKAGFRSASLSAGNRLYTLRR